MDHNTLTWNGKGWVEAAPTRCAGGHTLAEVGVLVGSHVCSCEVHHHRTHRCRKCGAVTYTPERGPQCEDGSFDGRGTARPSASG